MPRPVGAQTERAAAVHPSAPATGDLLLTINRLDGSPWAPWLGSVDRLAYPVMYGAVPAWWAVRLAEGDRAYADAWRGGLSWASASAVVFGIKHSIRRERPFRARPDVVRRDGYPGGRKIDEFSFPSGHSAITAALATSLSLSHPRWYVIAPAALWTASVGISRVWIGVHYPGDVIAGWVLGMLVAWGVDRLGDTVTPPGMRGGGRAPAVHMVLRL